MILQLKVPGKPPIPVTTNIPVTLYGPDGKILAVANGGTITLTTERKQKETVTQVWYDWGKRCEVEVVWSGASEKCLHDSKLKNQKGLLMPDSASNTMTKKIMDDLEDYHIPRRKKKKD